mmetsp:Transcript_23004/g.63880  ORF Transcript_23004/g.63880 Transcript_23004/m.63880 type:complete len:248 (+) Transcript_23004:873-1616(+)
MWPLSADREVGGSEGPLLGGTSWWAVPGITGLPVAGEIPPPLGCGLWAVDRPSSLVAGRPVAAALASDSCEATNATASGTGRGAGSEGGARATVRCLSPGGGAPGTTGTGTGSMDTAPPRGCMSPGTGGEPTGSRLMGPLTPALAWACAWARERMGAMCPPARWAFRKASGRQCAAAKGRDMLWWGIMAAIMGCCARSSIATWDTACKFLCQMVAALLIAMLDAASAALMGAERSCMLRGAVACERP